MAERLIRFKTISRVERALANSEVAEKGHIACIDLTDGSLVASQVSEDLLPIGWFEESFTGDGTKIMGVKLFGEIACAMLPNASVGPVEDGDFGSFCYLHSSSEVSMTGTGKSVAGRVWGLIGSNVLVQMASDTGPQGPQGDPA